MFKEDNLTKKFHREPFLSCTWNPKQYKEPFNNLILKLSQGHYLFLCVHTFCKVKNIDAVLTITSLAIKLSFLIYKDPLKVLYEGFVKGSFYKEPFSWLENLQWFSKDHQRTRVVCWALCNTTRKCIDILHNCQKIKLINHQINTRGGNNTNFNQCFSAKILKLI